MSRTKACCGSLVGPGKWGLEVSVLCQGLRGHLLQQLFNARPGPEASLLSCELQADVCVQLPRGAGVCATHGPWSALLGTPHWPPPWVIFGDCPLCFFLSWSEEWPYNIRDFCSNTREAGISALNQCSRGHRMNFSNKNHSYSLVALG